MPPLSPAVDRRPWGEHNPGIAGSRRSAVPAGVFPPSSRAVAGARARFDKSDAAERREVVTRHPGFAVKRLPTTTAMTMTRTRTAAAAAAARYRRRTCGDDTDVHMHTRASPGHRDGRGHHPTATHRRDGDTTFALVGVIAFSSAMLTEERYCVTARLLCYAAADLSCGRVITRVTASNPSAARSYPSR